MDVITTKNLTKVYNQGEISIYAAKDVSITIKKGEMVAIVGKSGSGKTTLLNMLGGIDKPSSGSVLLNDTDIYAANDETLASIRRQKIGYIFQNFNLIPILNAKENIMMPMLLDSKKPDSNYFDELVDIMGIKDRLTHLPSELSGGQQQRVAIARALINHPQVILADEPTGNLDKASADDILNLLRTINQKGNTVVIVTHDEKYANMCHRIIRICDGEIVEE
jgi:ABC-type lipoprotein export system ATPase subunit